MKKLEKFRTIIEIYWRILWYISIVAGLSTYIVRNWSYAIDFTPFSNFNGNNLLFVVWIIVILLPCIRVEFKGGKAGLHTGNSENEYIKTSDVVVAKNMSPPSSIENDITRFEQKINAAKGVFDNELDK